MKMNEIMKVIMKKMIKIIINNEENDSKWKMIMKKIIMK